MDTKFHVLEMETSVQQGIKVDLCSRHFDHKDSVLINRLMPLSKGTAAGIELYFLPFHSITMRGQWFFSPLKMERQGTSLGGDSNPHKIAEPMTVLIMIF